MAYNVFFSRYFTAEQMMRDATHRTMGNFVGDGVQPAIHLHCVGVDNFAFEGPSNIDSEGGLARSRRPHNGHYRPADGHREQTGSIPLPMKELNMREFIFIRLR